MYKKITHTITEEHFGHPIAAEIKKVIDKNNPRVKTKTLSAYSTTDKSTDLRNSVHAYFTQYIYGIRAYIVSAMASSQDADIIRSELFSLVENLEPIYQRFWHNAVDSTALNKCLHDIAMNILSIADSTKAGKDVGELKNTLAANIDSLAVLLDKTNPQYWPKQAVVDIWTSATDSFIEQIDARKKADWPADQDALKKTWNILVNSVSTDAPSFADVFVKGILQMFPYRFFQ